jgi:hypothetical protein
MKTKTIFLTLGLILILPSISSGQIGNMIKNKAARVINAGARTAGQEIAKEADTAVQKNVQKEVEKNEQKAAGRDQPGQASEGTGNQNSGQANQGGGGKMLAGLLGGKVDLKYNDEYSFSSRMYSQMEMYDKKDVTKMDYYLFFSKNSPTAGIETKTIDTQQSGTVPLTTQMIMDGENKCFLMLTDINGMKMGMISAVPDSLQEQSQGKSGEAAKTPVVIKTANTKIIAGYKCDEYIYREADSKEYSKMWFTKDAVLNVDKKVWSKSGMPAAYGYSGFDQGIVMAWESYDKDNKMTAKSEVKEVNNDFKYSMSPKGYTLRQINFNQNQKK